MADVIIDILEMDSTSVMSTTTFQADWQGSPVFSDSFSGVIDSDYTLGIMPNIASIDSNAGFNAPRMSGIPTRNMYPNAIVSRASFEPVQAWIVGSKEICCEASCFTLPRRIKANSILIGSSAVIRAEFKDLQNQYVDPDRISVRFYDSFRKPIGFVADGRELKRIGTGIYEYIFQVPDGHGLMTYEVEGFLQGVPALYRENVVRKWAINDYR